MRVGMEGSAQNMVPLPSVGEAIWLVVWPVVWERGGDWGAGACIGNPFDSLSVRVYGEWTLDRLNGFPTNWILFPLVMMARPQICLCAFVGWLVHRDRGHLCLFICTLNINHRYRYWPLKGDSSDCSLGSINNKTKVMFYHKGSNLKGNFNFVVYLTCHPCKSF